MKLFDPAVTGCLPYTKPEANYFLCIYHKNEKGKLCEMDLPLLKNDITTTKAASQNEIYSETVEKVRFWHFFEFYI